MDIETALYFWSTILTIAALVLFVEAVALIRYFFRHRRPPWQRLLILLPLSVSVWSFIVVCDAPPPLPGMLNIHFSYAMYYALKAPFILGAIYDQRLLAVCAGVFVLTLVIECIFHVRYRASSQYSANTQFVSHLARSVEVPMQASARQSWEIQSRGRC